MQPNVECAQQPAANADQSENEELLRIEGKVHGKVGGEHRRDGLLALEPNRQQTKHRGAANRGEETAPVVPHCEIHRGDLDAEEYATDRRRKAGGNPHSAGRGQHLAIPALVLVDTLKARDQLRKECRDDAGDVHKRTLLAER